MTSDGRGTKAMQSVNRAMMIISRVGLTLLLTIGLSIGTSATAAASSVEYLSVPSAAMGRDVPVAFLGGGAHAIYLLDAFNAGDTVSNWITAGNAMNTLADKGISGVAPAGGAYSLYT